MMKGRILIFLLFASLGFSACKKDDSPVFSESADERLNKALTSYQDKLVAAENGWKGFIYPASGGIFFFYFKFNAQNRVKMYSTFDSASAVTPRESSYRLKALQQPSLIFDTYSYVHVLADPNENAGVLADINGGPVGVGLESDFEFYFDTATTDSIELIGRFNQSRAVLIKATKQEADAFDNKELGRGLLFQNINRYLNYFRRITVGGVTYEITMDQRNRTITLSWLSSSGILQSFTTPFYYSVTGVSFVNALMNGNQTITGFTNITWNPGTTTLGFTVNGNPTTVTGFPQPLKVDLTAPQRWYNLGGADPNFYWYSFMGFHSNGVDDAFNVRSLTSSGFPYYYMIYYPKFQTNNDFFGPIFVNLAAMQLTLEYGSAPRRPTFTSDGRAIFSELGEYPPHPTTGPAALSRSQLYNPTGYYFVQTGPATFDMVSAVDAKTWITWEAN